jgi:hypothetical protein
MAEHGFVLFHCSEIAVRFLSKPKIIWDEED